MSKEINLLPSKDKNLEKQKKILKILWILASFSLFVVFATSGTLFFLKLTSPVSALTDKQQKISANISQLAAKESQFNFLSDRLLNLSKIIVKRQQFDKMIDFLLEITPVGASINSISMGKSKISATFTTKSLSVANDLHNKAQEMTEEKKIFKKVTMNGITLNQRNGDYTFSLDIEL